MTDEYRIYRITNKDTGKIKHIAEHSAQEACDYAGWAERYCFVKECATISHMLKNGKKRTYVKIPCEVCPYQYAVCSKPPGKECEVRSDVPDWREWIKAVAKAHLCPHEGDILAPSDHKLHQRWAKIEEAIRILSPK